MNTFRNIAAYKFAPLTDLKSRRSGLLAFCRERGIKGTILLSGEGINLFVAGAPEQVEALLGELRAIPGLEDLRVKESESAGQPFNRMLVRLKREIIAFGVPGIDPSVRTSPKIAPQTLRQWLDEGRPVTLLDTRNDYEVKLGTFQNARAIGVDHFRDFPQAVAKLPPEMKEQPIVMFCTGGIRCEKAGPFMEREGFRNIFQLDGGILKYFEDCGGAHYRGECFVFDQRVGVDPALRETESAQCWRCLSPLTGEEQRDPRYVEGESCPYCHKTGEEQAARNLARRHEAIRRAVTPLPGSAPYDNFRPISIPNSRDGLPLVEALTAIVRHIPRHEWEALFAQNLILDNGRQVALPDRIARAGERYLRKLPGIVEPDVNGRITILHEDQALIVLDKPAPLPMHPGGRFNRNTLQHILDTVYHPERPHPAHRLDANTSGVLLVTRARRFAAKLQPQFARGEVRKTYLVRAQGHPPLDAFSCDAPIGAEPSDVGARLVDTSDGLAALTEFRVLSRDADGTALLEARPLTGRTNQIRAHLWKLGWPVVGDPAYLADGTLGETQTLRPDSPPLCLHASAIEFTHPLTGRRMKFEAPSPAWVSFPSKSINKAGA